LLYKSETGGKSEKHSCSWNEKKDIDARCKESFEAVPRFLIPTTFNMLAFNLTLSHQTAADG
jgi:hypothetical protein